MKKKTVIAVIRLSALGDVAMTLPVVCALAEQYPECDILFLTREAFGMLFSHVPPNVHPVLVNVKGKHRGIAGIFRMLRILGSRRVDCVADLHNVLRSWIMDALLCAMGKRVCVVDKQRWARRRITSGCRKNRSGQADYMSRYADVFHRLGLPLRRPYFKLPLKGLQGGLPGIPVEKTQPWVGVAPFASYFTKIYPLPDMKKVVGRLAEQDCHVFLFGGRGNEQRVLQSWAKEHEGVTSIPGTLTLQQELELMSRLDVMLTMDSSNMHLASWTGCPVVSVWGGTTPDCGFWNQVQNRENALCAELPCQPCSISGTKTCGRGDMACMTAITPEMIMDKVNTVIDERQRHDRTGL